MENTLALAAPLGFPVGHGVTRADADSLGAWWDDNRDFIQPSEFILSRSGKVMMSTYSNSPIGRMEPEETLTLLKYLNAQRQKQKAQAPPPARD
jgi:hypothetical protein